MLNILRNFRSAVSMRAEWLLIVAVTAILSLMGIDRASATMGAIWRAIAPRLARQKRAIRHLGLAFPEKSAAEIHALSLDMWENLGRTTAETLLHADMVKERQRYHIDWPEDFVETVRNGAIFVSYHGGNWEIAALPAYYAGVVLDVVYRPLHNPITDEILRKLRSHATNGTLIPTYPLGAQRIRAAIRQKRCVAMLADLWDPVSIEVPFFGRPASAVLAPAVLARRYHLPVVITRAVRRDGVRFDLEARFVPYATSTDIRGDIEALTRTIQAQFEAWIRAYPAQWMWAHDKWEPIPASNRTDG